MNNVTNGFEPVATAITIVETSAHFETILGQGFLPKNACTDSTPLAQTTCLSARDFPAGAAPVGEVHQGFILTEGNENFGDQVTLLLSQVPRSRLLAGAASQLRRRHAIC